jgi:hypothetical protein
MLCKISIGFDDFILPNETGVATIMKALSKAIRIQHDKRYVKQGFDLDIEPVKVSFEYLPGYKLTSRKQSQSAAIEPDEILPPVRGRIAASSRDRQLPASRRLQLPFNLEA